MHPSEVLFSILFLAAITCLVYVIAAQIRLNQKTESIPGKVIPHYSRIETIPLPYGSGWKEIVIQRRFIFLSPELGSDARRISEVELLLYRKNLASPVPPAMVPSDIFKPWTFVPHKVSFYEIQ